MAELPVMLVRWPKKFGAARAVLINAADFDASQHEVFDPAAVTAAVVPVDVDPPAAPPAREPRRGRR